MKTIGMLCGFLYVGQLDTWKWMWTEKSVVIDCFLVTFEPFPFDTYMHILVHQIVWDPWRLVGIGNLARVFSYSCALIMHMCAMHVHTITRLLVTCRCICILCIYIHVCACAHHPGGQLHV